MDVRPITATTDHGPGRPRRARRLRAFGAVAVAVVALIAVACGSGRGDAESPSTGPDGTTAPAESSFGDLPTPCGPGDAAGRCEPTNARGTNHVGSESSQ